MTAAEASPAARHTPSNSEVIRRHPSGRHWAMCEFRRMSPLRDEAEGKCRSLISSWTRESARRAATDTLGAMSYWPARTDSALSLGQMCSDPHPPEHQRSAHLKSTIPVFPQSDGRSEELMNTALQHKASILRCANCGALLAVSPGVERFGCKYCAAELVVVRQDETTALKRVVETI